MSRQIEEGRDRTTAVGRNVEERWESFKEVLTQSAVRTIGYRKRKAPRKPWITQEMLDKMDERRKWKNVDTPDGKAAYNKLNNELRRVTDKAREDWWDSECSELEEQDKRGRSDLVYAKVKQLTWKSTATSKSCSIKDQQGQLLTEPDEVRRRWKEYVEILYDKDGKPGVKEIGLEEDGQVEDDRRGPELLENEIEAAIKHMKNNKAVGADGIPAEFFKILGNNGTKEVTELCKGMYRSGEWPSDFTRTVMIPLPKKTNATKCEYH
jgi:hypothetical protein